MSAGNNVIYMIFLSLMIVVLISSELVLDSISDSTSTSLYNYKEISPELNESNLNANTVVSLKMNTKTDPGLDYSIIVFIENDNIIAEDDNGIVIFKENAETATAELIQSAINYIHSKGGGKLLLKQATYIDTPKYLGLYSNIIIEGEGNATILNNIGIYIESCSNVTIRNINFRGDAYYAVWVATGSRNTILQNLTASLSSDSLGAFIQSANNGTIENTKYINCRVFDSGSFGFLNDGKGSPKLVKNIEYINCEAIRCGHKTRNTEWITGFDIAENCDVENISLINCRAEQNWESGFHIEDNPHKKNVELVNCTSINNGRAKSSPLFGSGFLASSGMNLTGCNSSNNFVGYRITNNKLGGIIVSNSSDIRSSHAMVLFGDAGTVNIDEFTSSFSQLESIMAFQCGNISAKSLRIIEPIGNPRDKLCTSFITSRDCNFNILSWGGSQPTFILSEDSSNITFSGAIRTGVDYALHIENGSNILVDSMEIDSNGVAGISVTSSRVEIKNTSIKNTKGGMLEYGIIADRPSDIFVDINSVRVSGGVATPFFGF